MLFAEIQDVGAETAWEQLWARQLDERLFELCCIPFFAYDLALGDVFETKRTLEKQHVLSSVISRSGHRTFRAWFEERDDNQAVLELLEKLKTRGHVWEWHSSRLLAIDAIDSQSASELDRLLRRSALDHLLIYEPAAS